MATDKPQGQESETPKRNTPRSEDPARLNDLNSDKKPAPPQPKVGDTPEAQTDKPEGARAAVEKGQRPQPTIEQDKPTNPPHPEKDGTLWAQATPSESE